ncbi:LptA/OstA family protein [Methylocystis heyeri]|uniref:Organic solvent tolerance protein OstA n=1 Tax=Methylocystis heyeri TaxID=391905 RepID=A0A6B8KHL7_9HYPH|nr:LptA/OstA family protein [Methylocystis heyeri]QGM47864.1 organic solvent tolerance protein OstA [Methylocystis heyeri]
MRLQIFSTLLAAALVSVGPAHAKGGRSGGILPGASAKDPLNIDAGKLDYFDKEQKLVYSGSVIVVNGPSTLKASKLTIFLQDKGAGAKTQPSGDSQASSDRVKHIEAEGPVTMVSKDQVGTGDHGSYDRSENKVYLNGNVVLTQGESVTKGDRLVYDITTGQAVVQAAGGGQSPGRVHSIFTPKEK